MTLTNQQLESFQTLSEAIHARKPVLLTGRSNGKTTLIHQALEVLAQKDDTTGEYVSNNPNAPRIEYFPRVYFPDHCRTSVQHLMRQVLAFAGEKVPHQLHEVVPKFEALMNSLNDQNRVICLAVDNAELLGPKAFFVLKALNEYRDVARRRNIGVAILVAGELSRLKKMPREFVDRCTEISIGKVKPQEIADFIHLVYPGQVRWFTDGALETLADLGTTLQIRKVLDRVVRDRTLYRSIEIDNQAVAAQIHQLAQARLAA